MSLPCSLFKELPLTDLPPGQASSFLLPVLVMNFFFPWSLSLSTPQPSGLKSSNCSSIKPSVNHQPLNMLAASCTCRGITLILVPCWMAKTLKWSWGAGKRSHPVSASGHALVRDDQHLASLGLINQWDILQKWLPPFGLMVSWFMPVFRRQMKGKGAQLIFAYLAFFFIKYPLWWVEHGDRGEISKNDLAVS